MLTKEQVEKILSDSGALLSGHFLLTSGKHSGNYMQCAKILQHPEYSEALAKELAEQLSEINAEIVIGPAMGGIVIAYELARQLGALSMFAERDSEGKMVLRRGFDELVSGKRVVVAEDVITTGGSVIEVIEAVRQNGGNVVAAAVLVDRSGGKIDFGVRLAKAYTADFQVYEHENCPLCKGGSIPVKPGSRKS